MTAWPTLAAYKAWARVADTLDDAQIQPSLDAATAAVLERCSKLVDSTTGEPVAECPPDVYQAVLLWTNRLVNRRNSPTGVIGVADSGTAYVPSRDADISRLLAPWRTMVAG